MVLDGVLLGLSIMQTNVVGISLHLLRVVPELATNRNDTDRTKVSMPLVDLAIGIEEVAT